MSGWAGRFTFEVSSAEPDSASPVWVDLSPYLLTTGVGDPLEPRVGRQNDLEQTEPASVEVVLQNVDDRFTFGNTSSPYAAWWGPGRKCRIRETIGTTVMDVFTGYLQMPSELVVSEALNQQVTVSAIDRLGRLAAAPTFISNLGAHILGSAGASTGLRAYWPLVGTADGESAGPVQQGALRRTPIVSAQPTSTALQLIQFSAGNPPPGEDASPTLWVPADLFDMEAYRLHATLSTPITLSVGQYLTLVCWFKTSPDAIAGWTGGEHYVLLEGDSAFDGASLFRDETSTGGQYKGAITTLSGSWGTNFEGASMPGPDVWHIFAGHYQLAASQALWFDAATDTSSFGGSPPSSVTFSQMTIGTYGLNGSLCHVQVYVDDGTGFTQTEFLAQRDIGLYGLERQTTGDRIRSIAKYAGIPLAEYNDTVDKGTAVMQAASLADKTPLEAMREAERTEQGLLYVDGSGRLVFKDRRSLYNV